MVDADRFISGASIKWARLGQFALSALASAVGLAYVETIFAFGDFVLTVPSFFGEYFQKIITLWAGVGLAAVSGSWAEALSFVEDAGIFALAVSVGLVIASWWILSLGVDRLG